MSFKYVYQCDVCFRNKSVRLLPLVDQEKVFLSKLIRCTKRPVPLRKPLLACEHCFEKLHIFKFCILRIVKQRILIKINEKMQYPTTPIKDEGMEGSPSEETIEEQPQLIPQDVLQYQKEPSEIKYEETSSSSDLQKEQTSPPNIDGPCSNDYNCKCENCENKYGSLPLLLQGIEEKYKTATTEPQPSTSSQHVDSRSPKKIILCQYCNKSFTHKGDYNKHLRKHTREQPFSCAVCNRKFAHSSNLQRHQRLHSGQRPFVCRHCDKSFSRKDKLDCHRRSKICKEAGASTNSD